ncbi:MAG TPA: DUF1275 family protein [Lichenihabitans sp.]|jgi:uncharacterized membrane protein YoaK (UPF0700 family)|nr:DUF1275 family protein [Lichenihabitans sp.]
MTSLNLRLQALAAILAALAGYVDASGFLATGGFFVSFMSGNSTRLGIGAAQDPEVAAVAAGLIGAFSAGIVLGAIAGDKAGDRRRPVVLGLVAMLLAAAAGLGTAGLVSGSVVAMAMAMGVENNVFARNGQVSLGVTYMTGSLVKLGQGIAKALLGRDRFGWVPYLVLWLGFVLGVGVGTVVFRHVGLAGLWGAAALAGVLVLATAPGRVRRPSGAVASSDDPG